MKKLQIFWSESAANKLIVSIVFLILACCILAACITVGLSAWLLFANPSTPPAPASFTPTKTLSAPTLTPLPVSPTEDIAQEHAYFNALKTSLEENAALWNEFTIFTSYASQYPEAINDADWRDEFNVLLNEMDESAEKLKELPPAPEKFTEIQNIVAEFSTNSQEVTRVMRQYLDTRDETLVNELKPLQEKLAELQSRLDAEITQMENE